MAEQNRQPVTHPALRSLNEQYASKITKGEIEVRASQQSSLLSPYELALRRRKIDQAEKQKQELERKLASLNHSIQVIQQDTQPPPSPSQNAAELTAIKKKQAEIRQKAKEQQRRAEERRQEDRRRQEEKERKEREERERQLSEEKVKKKQQILEKVEKIKQRMEGRQEEARKQHEEYRRLTEQKTLFRKLEEEYASKESGLLAERKKKLADIRSLHRPISHNEIEEHQQKFMEVIREKEEMRERERRLTAVPDGHRVSYKSPAHLEYSRSKSPDPPQAKLKADKMRQFSEHVRENFVPAVDDSKRESLEKMLEEEQERRRRKEKKVEEERERVEEIRSKGLRYLEEVREMPKRRPSPNEPPKTDRTQYKNYLTHSEHSGNKWQKILGGEVSRREKAVRVQMEAERLEASLRRKEQKARLVSGDSEEVDQEYFEMIKAKLDLLQI